MDKPVSAPALLNRIGQLRRSLRGALVLHGLALVLAALLWTALILALGDYLFHFPGVLRLILLVGVGAGTAFLLWRDIIARLLRPIPDQFLAGILQHAAALPFEQLQSAVEFMENKTDRRNILAAKAILEADHAAQSVRVGTALSWRPVLRLWMAVILAMLSAAALIGANPGDAALCLQRWAGPLAHHPWPLHQRVQLVWNTSDGRPPAIWPRGQALPVRAQVTKGFSRDLRVWLDVREADQSTASQLMTWQGLSHGHLFEKVLLPRGTTVRLRPVAGDDRGEPWTVITLMPRPRIITITADIAPPPYAAKAPSFVLNLLDRQVSVIRGSTITMTLTADQPLQTAAGRQAFAFVNPVGKTPIAVAAQLVHRTANALTIRWWRKTPFPRGCG